MVTQLNEI